MIPKDTKIRIAGWPGGRAHLNPYTRLLYTELTRLGAEVYDWPRVWPLQKFHILHLHWPERAIHPKNGLFAILHLVGFMILLSFARWRGARVVWTVHNLKAHENHHRLLEPLLWRWLVPRLDGIVALTRSGQQLAIRRYPSLAGVPCKIVPHGHYRGYYPDTISRLEARRRLGLTANEVVCLYFGSIRDYKNVPQLLDAFRKVDNPCFRLVIAGCPDSQLMLAALQDRARRDPRVLLHCRVIPEDEIQVFMRAADLCVLPFRDVLNSGSAILALSFDIPVLVPAAGALPELADLAGSKWVRIYEGQLTPEVIQAAIEWARERDRGSCTALASLSWSKIALTTLEFFTEICHSRPVR